MNKLRSIINHPWIKDHLFHSLMLAIMMLFILAAIVYGSPPKHSVIGAQDGEVSSTPEAVEYDEKDPNTYPPEILESNRSQTNSVVFGGVLLILIIVGGTLRAMRVASRKN